MEEPPINDLSDLGRLLPDGWEPPEPAAEEAAGASTLPALHVRLERKGRRGKTVTVIEGFDVRREDLAELARALKTRCGTGGTVREGSVELQGDHRRSVADHFAGQGRVIRGSI